MMIYINVLLTAKNEADIPRIRELLIEQRRLSLQEPGCERFEMYQSNVDRRLFILNERWTDQAALDAHRLAVGYNTIYVPQVLPLVDRAGHLCELVEA